MSTAAPIRSTLLAVGLAAAVVWEGVNLWRQPDAITMPATSAPAVPRDLGVQTLAASPDSDSMSRAPPRVSSTPLEAATSDPPNGGPAPAAVTAPRDAVTRGGSADAPSTPRVDETALRYFARKGDTLRLNAEITRLHTLYPDWNPPEDPLKAPPIADARLDAMWRQYAQGQFAAVRDAIAARQSEEAGWTPPQNLLDSLALADTRERLINASDAKQYGMVVQIAAATPGLRTCGDVDILWRTAEGFVRTNRQGRAFDVYRYILANCTDGPERLATMQKAAALLPRQSLAPLLGLGHAGQEEGEFRSIGEDLARRSVSAGGADAKADASEDDIATVERLADAGRSAADPMLLGWYFLRRDDATRAEHWFRVSFDRENAADSARGLALSLIKSRKPAEAETTLARWRDADDDSRKAYLAAATSLLAQQPAPVVAPDVLARVTEAIAKRRDAPGAQQLGWYSHAYGQDETAARWFSAALAWKPDDEPSAYGLGVVDSALDRGAAVRALARIWRARSPRILALIDPAAARDAAAGGATPASQERGQSPDAAPRDEVGSAGSAPAPAAKARRSSLTPDEGRRVAIQRTTSEARQECSSPGTAGAWCLMRLHRPTEAAAAFRAALATGNSKERQEAAYGLSLADLQLGLTADADIASSSAPQANSRARDLRVAVLTQRIRADYNAGSYADVLVGLDARARIAPESFEMMTLRGWSYYHLQRFEEAKKIFAAIAAAGHE